ncbi:hypothetical protein LS684_23960 (plasmid) [Cytobacillus spongiae]|uniref:hypothetical protein n=1 Tax=Cytobacillus spongiae TaxID=2901381 RepID=UPI00145C57BC|nr:hypothetical protein [Cytobacillus spongiae]MCA1063051.1 hypothetical protein [Rossellomorea aquimaris]NMH70383.1 hypothetical protein [Bacillus sp. RO3]UII58642.1 hypothetical protein LS684_23960 [Cytobacillus spongiae]WJV28329.1 hypothetical protein QTG56_14605 [Rossellomorea sp. AcN35-11]
MVNVLIILSVSFIMFFVDFPHLKKSRKELAVYVSIILFGISLFVAEAFHIEVPNPLEAIIFVFKPVTDWINKLFK